MNDLDWKQPALIGGLIAGILSVIPVVSLANCCFCAWALVGGAVASKMVIDRTPRPVRSGEGAQVGLMAGLVAAGIYVVLGVPLALLGIGEGMMRQVMEGMSSQSADPQFQEMMQKILEASANQSSGQKLAAAIPFLLIAGIVLGGFTVLGGLLGVALFEKRKGQPPPPQYPGNYPPGYPPNDPPQSGGYGGGYGGGTGGGQSGGWPQS
ncbi:MAG: hypothetical protein ACREEM_22580 [Blastocatellia bacterium]